MNNLDSITGEFTIRTCNALSALSGLDGLVYVNGSVIIRDNAVLQDLNALNALVYIGETLELVENAQLNSVSGLSNVQEIVGGLEGGIFIEANSSLTSLAGLGNNSTVVGSNLDLLLNPSLSTCAVPVICNYLANPPVGAVVTINGNLTGCNSQAEIQSQCSIIAGTDEQSEIEMLVYPNPLTDFINLETTSSEVFQVECFDLSGRLLFSRSMVSSAKIDLSSLSPGAYWLRFIRGTEVLGMEKIVRIP